LRRGSGTKCTATAIERGRGSGTHRAAAIKRRRRSGAKRTATAVERGRRSGTHSAAIKRRSGSGAKRTATAVERGRRSGAEPVTGGSRRLTERGARLRSERARVSLWSLRRRHPIAAAEAAARHAVSRGRSEMAPSATRRAAIALERPEVAGIRRCPSKGRGTAL
jgi:hypothetical protein